MNVMEVEWRLESDGGGEGREKEERLDVEES